MRPPTDVIRLCSLLIIGVLGGGSPLHAQDLATGDDPVLRAAIGRNLPVSVSPDEVEVRKLDWNGQPVALIDYVEHTLADDREPAGDTLSDVVIKVLVARNGVYQAADLDTLEEEGGIPHISAVALANADGDKAKELLVLVTWPVRHANVSGTLYEVRVFDDLAAGARPLTAINEHFGGGCDCWHDDGAATDYRFKTVAAIESELASMGY